MDAPAPRYDALLLMSFGGPEAPDEVVPFLANVTRGSGIPESRLAEVGQHYFGFGGKSPINDQCRALIAALEQALVDRDRTVPVYWGNRHWHPLLPDTLAQIAADGHRRVLAVATSAYPSYSGCRAYREALEAALPEGMRVDVLGNYARSAGFLDANTEAVVAALRNLPEARLVLVTHSIPVAMAETAGPEPRAEGGTYVAWHREVAATIAARAAAQLGRAVEHDLVYCSRSGPPQQRWLEPDVNDHLAALADAGVREVVLAPIGFISDHMEVIYDLDTQAAQTARELGIRTARAATAGTHPAFVGWLADAVCDRLDGAVPPDEPTAAFAARSCGVGCCPNRRRPAPH